jgi:hypothetical protein
LPLGFPFPDEVADALDDPLDPEHAATRTAIAAAAAAAARRRQAGASSGLFAGTPPRPGTVLVDLIDSPRQK